MGEMRDNYTPQEQKNIELVKNGTKTHVKPRPGRVAGSFLKQLNFNCLKEFNIFLISYTVHPTPSHPVISRVCD